MVYQTASTPKSFSARNVFNSFMGKHPRRQRSSDNYRAVRFSNSLAAGALASVDLTSGQLLPTADAAYRLLRLDMVASWLDIADEIDGLMMFGVAHGDYSTTEMEEAIEATSSINQGDMIAKEQASRQVRICGVIKGSPEIIGQDDVFDEGKKHRHKLNWRIPIGKALDMFVFNQSGTIWSTGSSLILTGIAHVLFD